MSAITAVDHPLPHGITLHCRVAGTPGRPLLLFLHGFPEGAFVWDALLAHFSEPAHGGYRCVAPFLRGYAPSSAPAEVQAYRARHLLEDLTALIGIEASTPPGMATVVAHDWGGALAWSLANRHAPLVERLMILNAPHPGAFLRELRNSPAQQQASAYMHFLRRPDAEELLAAQGFRRLFRMFADAGGHPPAWLTPELHARYEALWSAGLTGACHYYRASPLYPPCPGPEGVGLQRLEWPAATLHVPQPTLVLWGMDDPALLPGLLDGLQDWVPRLTVQRAAGATHWLLHERPALVRDTLASLLNSKF